MVIPIAGLKTLLPGSSAKVLTSPSSQGWGEGQLTHVFRGTPFQAMAYPSKPVLMAHTIATVFASGKSVLQKHWKHWEIRISHHSPSSK